VWKLGLVALIVVGVPWLFLKTVRDTMSEPYVIDDAALSGWRGENLGKPAPKRSTS
jgi:hypothetical protein